MLDADMCHVFQLLAPVELFGRYSFQKLNEFCENVASHGTIERKCVEYIKGGANVQDIEGISFFIILRACCKRSDGIGQGGKKRVEYPTRRVQDSLCVTASA